MRPSAVSTCNVVSTIIRFVPELLAFEALQHGDVISDPTKLPTNADFVAIEEHGSNLMFHLHHARSGLFLPLQVDIDHLEVFRPVVREILINQN